MGGGAWPFLVGGAICLVNSVNERDLSLLTSYVEIIAIVGLQRGIPSKRESSARVDYVPRPFQGYGPCPIAGTPSAYVCGCPIWGAMDFNPTPITNPGTNPVNHRVFERKLRPKPSGRGHACLGVTHRVAPNHASLIGTHGIGARLVSRAYGAVGLNWSPLRWTHD
ncbi:hypothetical protein L1887_57628 [Cichorium endivia]|nr:hypothetical protein L1887_57628 [Cichorium endivia]